MDNLLDTVEEMQERLGLAKTFRWVCQFMIAYLNLPQVTLPLVATDALETAKRFQLSQASPQQVDLARIQCWKFLDAKGGSTDFSDPENCAIRAVICMLHTEPSSDSMDLSELLSWFLMLVKKIDIDNVLPDADMFLKTYLISSEQLAFDSGDGASGDIGTHTQ